MPSGANTLEKQTPTVRAITNILKEKRLTTNYTVLRTWEVKNCYEL
jgi:hypothetical protein